MSEHKIEMIDWEEAYYKTSGEVYIYHQGEKFFNNRGERIDPESGKYWGAEQEKALEKEAEVVAAVAEKTGLKNPEKAKKLSLPKRVTG